MKIAYFLDFPVIGGACKVLLTQAYIMSKRGHEVLVVIPDDENGGHAHELDAISEKYALNIVTAAYPITTTLEGIDIVASLESYDKIIPFLLEEKMDLIHSAQINVVVELAARTLKIPHLMNIYQIELEAFDIKWLDVYPHYHSADSEFFCKRWGEGLHIPSECIRVAYEGNCLKRTDQEEASSFPIQIISIGVLAEYKNQLETIKFVWKCKKNSLQVRLTMLGNNDTPYGEKCKEFVKENNLEKEVVFEGVVLNIEDYFAQSDLMILSSTVESYPGVIVESMANRVPVISTPIAGIPELLKDGHNGFLTKGCGGEDIYEAFENFLLYKKDGRILDIISNAYQTYQQNHSYEAAGIRLEVYYDWILTSYDKQFPSIQVHDVKNIFEKFIKEKKLEEVDRETKSNLWFLYHLDIVFRSNEPQKVAIWGTGFWGKIVFEWLDILNCRDKFVGFIDTYKKGMYLNCPILENKEQAVKDCDVILVAVGKVDGCMEIIKYLEECGKKKNTEYFTILHAPIWI